MLKMICTCCVSTRIIGRPLGLNGYHCCLGCGLIFAGMNNRDEIRESVVSHYERVDPHEKVAGSKEKFFNSALVYLSSQIKKKKRSILDVGCGYGYFLQIASRMGWETSGVEVVATAVREANKKVIRQNIIHGTLKDAGYPHSSFDVITLWDVLFHVESPFEELRECYRVLQEGGIIGIRVRNVFFEKLAYRIFHSLKRINLQLGMKNPSVFHRYCFSSKSIYKLLARVGFSNIKVTNSPVTEGDPYDYTNIKGLVKGAKSMVTVFSKFVFWISSGRWLIGPSLLVWAEKPMSILKNEPGKVPCLKFFTS